MTDQNNDAGASPVSQKKRGCGFYALVGLAVFFGLGVLGKIIGPPPPNPVLAPSSASLSVPAASAVGGEAAASPSNDPSITAQEFAELKSGMSPSQVADIVGSPGEVISESSIAGYHTVMVKWDGSGLGNANATFQNGKLVSKAQFGL